jgi:peptidoglycan/LPS O-acetylase OafA/YrhL
MALIGVSLGIWLLRAGYTTFGRIWTCVFLWRAQRFGVWLIGPDVAPSGVTPHLASKRQRFLLSGICILGATVCAVGVYLWCLWPKEWQAGLVFILFGLLVLIPVTIKEIQSRRKMLALTEPSTIR